LRARGWQRSRTFLFRWISGKVCFISFCEQASFLTGRDGFSRLILKRRRVALGRGQAASKLVWRRTVAGPKPGPPNGPDELAIGRLFRLGLDRGVPTGGRRRLCEAGTDKCKHEKYRRNCAFHCSYLDAVRCNLVLTRPNQQWRAYLLRLSSAKGRQP